MGAARSRTRQSVVAFLAREIDEEGLRASGWLPNVATTRWFATYAGGRRNQPYKMPGPAGSFTRFRGDHPEALYRLDGHGGWILDVVTGGWQPHDAPLRLALLEELTPEEVDALYELDDWGSWYFDYEEGNWARAPVPRVSHYLRDLVIHEVAESEASRVADALGTPGAV
ncbi:MAG: hypothetical protein KY438_00400 [Actinobacteria bacterium]|nr:hypothetical protein [Actinomycetota bacterium]